MRGVERVFLVGAVISLFLGGAGALIKAKSWYVLDQAEAACRVEKAKQSLKTTPAFIECDSEAIRWAPESDRALWHDAQKRVYAQREAYESHSLLWWALGIFILASIPALTVWAWYFLLRRLSEIAAAIRGQ